MLQLLFSLLFITSAYAEDDKAMELEQLQAQVDVMLEEMTELQGYRTCGEQGMIYDANATNTDSNGCLKQQKVTPQREITTRKLIEPMAPIQNNLAPSARSFSLPPPVVASTSAPISPKKVQAVSLNKLTKPMSPVAPSVSSAIVAEVENIEQNPSVPNIPASYPSEKVKALVELAVAQALGGVKTSSTGEVVIPDVKPTMELSAGKPASIPNLVPNCQEGEFLTVNNGQVACRRAQHANKMACPPAVLRTWIDWFGKHVHFHVDYTPHKQTQNSEKLSHEILVECNNGKYKLLEVTRNECGGNQCKPGRKPAYSLTYYCSKDKSGRCYAKQNGHLVNHTFTESYIVKQY